MKVPLNSLGVLVAGNLLPQLIALISIPFLARIYSPENFGYMAVYLSIVSLSTVVASGRLEVLVDSTKTSEGVRALLGACAVLCMCVVGFLSIVLGVFYVLSVQVFKLPGLFLLMLPVVVIFGVICNFSLALCVREGGFKSVATQRGLHSLIETGLRFVFGLSGFLAAGQVIAHFFATAFSVKYLLGKANLFKYRLDFKNIDLSVYRSSLVLLASSVLETGVVFAVSTELVDSYGPAEAGYFFLAQRLCLTPVAILASALSEINRRQFGALVRSGETINVSALVLSMRFPICVAIFVCACMLVVPDSLIVYLLGDKWAAVGNLLGPLSLFVFFQIVVSPISVLILINRGFRLDLLINFIYLSLVVLSIICVRIYSLTLVEFLLLYAVSYAVKQVLSLLLTVKGSVR